MQVNYWPSTLDDVQTSPDSKEGQTISSATITGRRVKQVRNPAAASFSPLVLCVPGSRSACSQPAKHW